MELKDKTILVTGSTDGVGRVVAERLGAGGARVLVHGRDQGRAKAVVAGIEAKGGKAELLIADLSSLAEVRRLADAVRERTDRLDILINNAGVGTGGQGAKRQVSADGYELRFAVNYLAGFPIDFGAPASAGGKRAGAHRQCRLGRPAGGRFQRRHADPRL